MSSPGSDRGGSASLLFEHDDSLRGQYPLVAGMDEAGRGPLAGPVVAASVIFPPGLIIEEVQDSKKIPEGRRKILFWEIVRGALAVGVGIVDSREIDRINILNATKKAMLTAIDDLGIRPDIVLIDAVDLRVDGIAARSYVRGESVSASIAAASIVAKVVRDEIMCRYDEEYPGYGFAGHKGYGTKAHLQNILRLGPCPIHRRSFRGVMDQPLPLG